MHRAEPNNHPPPSMRPPEDAAAAPQSGAGRLASCFNDAPMQFRLQAGSRGLRGVSNAHQLVGTTGGGLGVTVLQVGCS